MKKNIHEEARDEFDKLIANKLNAHRLPDDLSQEWPAIEKELRLVRQAQIMQRKIWYSAAALLLIAFGIGFQLNNSRNEISAQFAAAFELRVDSLPLKKKNQQQPLRTAPQIRLQRDRLEPFREHSSSPYKRYMAENKAKNNVSDLTFQNKFVIDTIPVHFLNLEFHEQKQIHDETEIDYLAQEKIWKAVAELDHKPSFSQWAANAGIGGAQGLFSTVNSHTIQSNLSPLVKPLISKLASVQGLNNYLSDDYDDISHSTPLSFAFYIRKNLNREWAVESGLVYTYLATKFSWEKPRTVLTVKQQLHYLGIPLGIVWYAWNRPKWNFYFSGGAMLENGIRASYQTEEFFNPVKHPEKKSQGIDGVQWSLYGAMGISYHVYKEFGLFFEPRTSFYFDNNQPISARTAHAFTLGVGAGLRWAF